MQLPPDPRRATTSRPISGARSGPLGATVSRPLTSGRLSQPLRNPYSQPLPNPTQPPRRLQLSGLIDDRIRGVNARERQRAWLVDTVVLAQALITLMVMPGYFFPSPNTPILVTLAVALVCYVIAFVFNRFRQDVRTAVFVLIGGGVVATTAQVFATALESQSSAHTAQSALLFFPIILEAGLFLTPELTVLVSSACAILTVSGIFLALALGSDASNLLSQAYLVMVYALGLETFMGYLSWRLAQFIYETVKNAQTGEELRFSQARLSAAERTMNEQRRQLTQDVGVIQMAVSSALAHEYDTRIDIPDGDLAPLASSLMLLIQQFRSTNELERKVQHMEAQALAMVDMAGKLATGDPSAAPVEAPTDSALFSVRAALNQAQALSARRQSRLQEVAAEISNSLRHSREGISNTLNDSQQAQQIAGQLVSLVEALNQTAQRQGDLLAQARRALALALPAEVTQGDAADGSLLEPAGRDPEATGALVGLGDDLGIMHRYTGEFSVLDPIDSEAAGIPPMTTPLPAVNALPASENDAEQPSESTAPGEMPAALADAWLLLTLLQKQTAEEARAVSVFVHDLGVLSKHVRHTGVGLDWVSQAVDAIERGAEQMQQLASPSSVSGELAAESNSLGAPPATGAPARRGMATRPLESDPNLAGALDGLFPPQAEPPEAAPGSLRVSELIDLEPFSGAAEQTPPDAANPTATSGEPGEQA